jgi:hypothetical protein
MRPAACLLACVLCALPSVASASPGLHLTVGQLRLAQLPALVWSSPEPSASVSAVPPAAPAGTPPATRRAQQLSNALYIGDTWRLAGSVELSLHLTPNEEHCAPLARLTF